MLFCVENIFNQLQNILNVKTNMLILKFLIGMFVKIPWKCFMFLKIQINHKKYPFPKWKKFHFFLTNIIILQHLFNIEFYYQCITFGHSTFGHGMFNVV
jgi:hypothetical protein